MDIRQALSVIDRMESDGVIGRWAIGGAVGATFYVEPVATMDIDIFVSLGPQPGSLLLSLQPIHSYLLSKGYAVEGEYVIIAGWPVQFLPPTGPLAEEALALSVPFDVEGITAPVFSVEHLAAIALETGRAKNKARLLQFVESAVLDMPTFQAILLRHGLGDRWRRFADTFLGDQQ